MATKNDEEEMKLESASGEIGFVSERISKLELNSTNKLPHQPPPNHSTPIERHSNGGDNIASSEDSASTSTPPNNDTTRRRRSGSANGNEKDRKASVKVYYHIDDEPTPYCVTIEADFEGRITLGDFKATLNRSNFKFYCKVVDQEVGSEVKAEIRDDSHPLHKSPNGHYELFLLTAEGSSHSDGASTAISNRSLRARQAHIPPPGPAPSSLYSANQNRMFPMNSVSATGGRGSRPPATGYLRDLHHLGNRRRPFLNGDSTIYTAEESDVRLYSDDESRPEVRVFLLNRRRHFRELYDDDSRQSSSDIELSTSTDNITSVSRQHHHNLYRRRNRRQYHRRGQRGQPSRASSLSSMTETSMALEVITVSLNMDTVNFLGISIVGQSCARGDNGIYVANVMAGGAVALDGRIEPGDMILQVNDVSFENFTNDQAVEVLKEAVSKKGPIKLTVAKSFDGGQSNYFMIPPREPVRPIDTGAWVQHTNAVRGMMAGTSLAVPNAMNSIPEGSEGAPTPIPGQFHHVQPLHTTAPLAQPPMHPQFPSASHQRPNTSSSATTSNGSGGGGGPMALPTTAAGQQLGQPGATEAMLMAERQQRLDVRLTDKRVVLQVMAMPGSGLDIRDRTWLKISIPASFLGSQLVDWLMDHVDGLADRKDAKKYASELLKEKLIAHVVNKSTFSEQCYYVFGNSMIELSSLRGAQQVRDAMGSLHSMQSRPPMTTTAMDGGMGRYAAGALPGAGGMQAYPPHTQQRHQPPIAHSMISEQHYASCPPISPYPMPPNMQQPHNTHAVGRMGEQSQTSNNSNEGAGSSGGSDQHRRRAVIPPAPPGAQPFNPSSLNLKNEPGRAANTNLRTVHHNPPVEEYFVDHL